MYFPALILILAKQPHKSATHRFMLNPKIITKIYDMHLTDMVGDPNEANHYKKYSFFLVYIRL